MEVRAMSVNKKYLFFTIFLSLILIVSGFSGCAKTDTALEKERKADPVVAVSNNTNSPYTEPTDKINSSYNEDANNSNSSYNENASNINNQSPEKDISGDKTQNGTDEVAKIGKTDQTDKADETNGTEESDPKSGTDKANEKDGTGEPGNKQTEPQVINGLVRVQDVDPNIIVELRYATEDNFTGKVVYPNGICVLRESTAQKLANASKELTERGYRIKVWDAYRPIYVQRIFYEIVPDSRFVANPDKGGSKHNRGTAVDVTLVDMEGNELEMPSGFDDFTGKGSRNNKDISENAKRNVEMLTNVMVKNGFTTISTEWWHYNDSDSDNYNIIDVDLEEFLSKDDSVSQIDPYIGTLDALKDIIGNSKQLILVACDSHQQNKATLYTYEKYEEKWQKAFEPMDAVIGLNGLTNDKVEGDKKSPIGVFPLYRCFGRDENPGTKLSYTQFSWESYWVDDVNSKFYNTYQKGPVEQRWSSAEDLYAIGEPYKYFIVIEHNTANPVAGKGSAIFLHIWKGEGSYTSGCTAVSEENLMKIIKWLAPSSEPLIIQFPADDVQSVR